MINGYLIKTEKNFTGKAGRTEKEQIKEEEIRMKKLDGVGRDTIFYKIIDKEFEEVKQLLESTIDVNFQDKNGYSYLHCAAQVKSIEIVALLIDKGAIIDIQDKYGKTPLMVAVSDYDGDDKMIKFLLEYGANKEMENNYGISAKKVAAMKGIDL